MSFTRYHQVKWRKGSVFKADPEAALTEIEKLNAEHNGSAPDGLLVEHARNPQSVLHDDFEWDDAVAGFKYRLETERKIKRSLVVVSDKFTDHNEEPVEIRVFQRAEVRDQDDMVHRIWMNTFDMMKDACGRQQLLTQAKKELSQFSNKYQALAELSEVLEPIESFLAK